MDERFTMCNMAIEAGGKNGIIAPRREDHEATCRAGPRAAARAYAVRCSRATPTPSTRRSSRSTSRRLPPTVSFPHLPENAKPAAELADITIDQVVIGSCTNGRLEDLRQAASILQGRKVHPDVRCIIIPGTQEIYLQAIAEGPAGASSRPAARVSTPTCGPCLGGHMGVLAEGERAVATTNRNFVGRMGHADGEVYLASPAVAAASAVAGHVATPEEVARHGEGTST